MALTSSLQKSIQITDFHHLNDSLNQCNVRAAGDLCWTKKRNCILFFSFFDKLSRHFTSLNWLRTILYALKHHVYEIFKNMAKSAYICRNQSYHKWDLMFTELLNLAVQQSKLLSRHEPMITLHHSSVFNSSISIMIGYAFLYNLKLVGHYGSIQTPTLDSPKRHSKEEKQ